MESLIGRYGYAVLRPTGTWIKLRMRFTTAREAHEVARSMAVALGVPTATVDFVEPKPALVFLPEGN